MAYGSYQDERAPSHGGCGSDPGSGVEWVHLANRLEIFGEIRRPLRRGSRLPLMARRSRPFISAQGLTHSELWQLAALGVAPKLLVICEVIKRSF